MFGSWPGIEPVSSTKRDEELTNGAISLHCNRVNKFA